MRTNSLKILLVRPPMYGWPYHDSIFPLGMLSLAAAVVDQERYRIKLIDCPAAKIGWKSLERIIRQEKPDIVCTSANDTCHFPESSRLAQMSKDIRQETIVIVGGVHVSMLPEETLKHYRFDIVVCHEGEETFSELLDELAKEEPDLGAVKGVAFRHRSGIVRTPPRPLIEDLDGLPDVTRTYSFLEMDRYKKDILYGDAAIQTSRGCSKNCSFCVCWRHNAEPHGEGYQARFRQHSVDTVIKNIEVLYHTYRRRHFFFVDDAFNTNPDWTGELTRRLKEMKLDIRFTALLCADFIIRDERLGLFEKMVEAGLRVVICGVERSRDSDMEKLGKAVTVEKTREAFRIMSRYPQVVKLATAIVGLADDTSETVRELGDFILYELNADLCALQVATPLPGTDWWDEYSRGRDRAVEDFSRYDWSTPIITPGAMTKEELRKEVMDVQIRQALRPVHILKAAASPHRHQRMVHRYFYRNSLAVFLRAVRRRENPFSPQSSRVQLMKPRWYES